MSQTDLLPIQEMYFCFYFGIPNSLIHGNGIYVSHYIRHILHIYNIQQL
jgi:hypothetical protein